jgi:hypothetical protein
MKCFVIPVIIGASGIVTKGLKESETIPGKRSADSVQKETAVIRTSHMIRKVLQYET